MISAKNIYKDHWVIHLCWIPVMIAACLWLALHNAAMLTAGICALAIGISWIISYLRLQHLLLMLLAVLLPFSVEVPVSDSLNINLPSEPLLAIAIFSLMWDSVRKPGLFRQLINHESRWMLLFLLSFVVTTLFSTIPWVSIKFSIINLTYITIFFLWQKYLFQSKPNLFPKLLGLYSIAMAVVLVFSIGQFKNYGWNPATIRGIFQPFYKDNTIFGATSALVASFWAASIVKTKSPTAKIVYSILSLVFLGGVLLSTSRAAVLSLLVFLVVCLILLLRLRLTYIALAIASFMVVSVIFHKQVLDLLKEDKHLSHTAQFGYMEQLESSANVSSDISNVERLNRWTASLGMFSQRPVAGFGPGTYQFAYIPFQKEEFMNQLTVKDPWHIPTNSGGTAHSEYFLVLSEMGLCGMLGLLALLGRWLWIAFVKARNHPQRVNILMGFAVLSTYLFHAFFNNFLSTDKFAFLFWGTAAWMIYHFEQKEHEQQPI